MEPPPEGKKEGVSWLEYRFAAFLSPSSDTLAGSSRQGVGAPAATAEQESGLSGVRATSMTSGASGDAQTIARDLLADAAPKAALAAASSRKADLFLPFEIKGCTILQRSGDCSGAYIVDNSQLKSSNASLAYRKSMNCDDKNKDNYCVHYGETVVGKVEKSADGREWLRVRVDLQAKPVERAQAAKPLAGKPGEIVVVSNREDNEQPRESDKGENGVGRDKGQDNASGQKKLTMPRRPKRVTLALGDEVQVTVTFQSDSEPDLCVFLRLGEIGTVIEVDESGDALVRFSNHARPQWVFTSSFSRLQKMPKEEQAPAAAAPAAAASAAAAPAASLSKHPPSSKSARRNDFNCGAEELMAKSQAAAAAATVAAADEADDPAAADAPAAATAETIDPSAGKQDVKRRKIGKPSTGAEPARGSRESPAAAPQHDDCTIADLPAAERAAMRRSGVRGVNWQKHTSRWRMQVYANAMYTRIYYNPQQYLGPGMSEEDAILAAMEAAIKCRRSHEVLLQGDQASKPPKHVKTSGGKQVQADEPVAKQLSSSSNTSTSFIKKVKQAAKWMKKRKQESAAVAGGSSLTARGFKGAVAKVSVEEWSERLTWPSHAVPSVAPPDVWQLRESLQQEMILVRHAANREKLASEQKKLEKMHSCLKKKLIKFTKLVGGIGAVRQRLIEVRTGSGPSPKAATSPAAEKRRGPGRPPGSKIVRPPKPASPATAEERRGPGRPPKIKISLLQKKRVRPPKAEAANSSNVQDNSATPVLQATVPLSERAALRRSGVRGITWCPHAVTWQYRRKLDGASRKKHFSASIFQTEEGEDFEKSVMLALRAAIKYRAEELQKRMPIRGTLQNKKAATEPCIREAAEIVNTKKRNVREVGGVCIPQRRESEASSRHAGVRWHKFELCWFAEKRVDGTRKHGPMRKPKDNSKTEVDKAHELAIKDFQKLGAKFGGLR